MKRFFMIVAMLLAVACLASCAPKNTDKAKAKLEKAGYSVTVEVAKEVKEDGAVAALQAKIVNTSSIGGLIDSALDGKGLSATLYDSVKNAKAAFADTKNAEGKSNYELIGKWVVWGDADAIKAFKK